MSDPSHPPRPANPFGPFGSLAWCAEAFVLLMGARNAPVPPTWPADTLRARLTEICQWVDRLPHTGPPVPIAMRQWLYRWPVVPRTHPAYPWMQAIGRNARWALRLVDEGALDQAQQVYANVMEVMHTLSAELAEPDAVRGAKIMQGFSHAGQQRSDRYAPSREHACAVAKRLWDDDPTLSVNLAAKEIHRRMKPDESGYHPPARTIRRWIGHLKPPA
jgi:hypothetical protein